MEEAIVKPAVPLSEEVIHLSALDQQAQRHYAKPMLLFKLKHKGIDDPIIRHLKTALSTALCEYPDFASTVVPLPGSNRKELQLQLGPESGASWRVVDYTSMANKGIWTGGSFDELAAKNFLLADIASDRLVNPALLDIPCDVQALPGLGIQLSLIDGGMILAFCWHHTVSDARGANAIFSSWARHTHASILHGKTDDPATPSDDSRERWRLDYGTVGTTIASVPDYIIDPAARSPLFPDSRHLLDREDPLGAAFQITTWYLSSTALQELLNTLGVDASGSLFTPVEAVCALLWKHVSQARGLGQNTHGDDDDDDDDDATSLFTTRLEFRARLQPPLAGDFIGNICEPNARARVPISELCSPSTGPSLAALATAIRQATESVDEAAVRAYIGLINGLPAVTDLTWGYRGFPGPDFGVTDLSGLHVFRTDWGPGLGAPVSVRLAYREGGLLYLFPVDKEGGFEVQVLCEPEAVEKLRADDMLAKFVIFRG